MKRRAARVISIAVAALILVPLAAWLAAPWFVEDPLPALDSRGSVKIWRDREGREVWYERPKSGEWRFPVSLGQISPEAIEIMLAAEDARFYAHNGVDYRAILRAAWQNLVHLRTVSGASTISMQLADLVNAGQRRGLWRKFVQAAKARKMERLHTKEEILEAYLNNIPYGGKLYGIEAASRCYFGRGAKDLTLTDATILCGIPQAPNRLRPDRHPDAARRRQELVLRQLVRQGALSAGQADEIFFNSHRAYRDFTLPAEFVVKGEAREWSICTNWLSTIDSALNESIRHILARRTAATDGVNDAAAVLYHVPSGEIRAYVGTLDFNSRNGGEVDAASARRSAGSLLKPFIYLEAMKAGCITPETVLPDTPSRWGDYSPKNYDGTFRGGVTAREALARSLNLPAVHLVAKLSPARVVEAFGELGLNVAGKAVDANDDGLSLALGSAGYRLVDIVRAYATLARGDSPEARDVVSMLMTYPLPGTQLPLAWKTGTSNNHCDAWCVAFDREWVLGVWFGNKSGVRSDSLIGAQLAAPAAAEIMESLIGSSSFAKSPEDRRGTGNGERKRYSSLFPVPCSPFPIPSTIILSPAPRRYVPDWGESTVTLSFKANRDDVYWYCDGEGLGTNPPDRAFSRGRHHVVAVPDEGPVAEVTFTCVSP